VRKHALGSRVRAWSQALTALAVLHAALLSPAPAAGQQPPAATPETSAAGAPAPPDPVFCQYERYLTMTAAPGFDPHLADEVRKDLAAELSPRGFGVCSSRAAQGELVADITLVQREPALVAIQVEDYTTGKRVARDVRLARIPSAGVALAIAIAADELLRASWAELLLRREAAAAQARADAAAEPRAPTAFAAQRVRGTSPRGSRVPAALGVVADYTHASRSWNSLGFDVRLQLRPFLHGLFELGGGGRWALPVEGEFGTVRGAGLAALLGLGGCGEPSERLALCGGARGTVQWTRFKGDPEPGARLAQRAGVASFVLSAVAQARLGLVAGLFLLAEFALGGALASARAEDPQRTVLGLEGLVLGAALGLGYSL
jgi:hypothetical protein